MKLCPVSHTKLQSLSRIFFHLFSTEVTWKLRFYRFFEDFCDIQTFFLTPSNSIGLNFEQP